MKTIPRYPPQGMIRQQRNGEEATPLHDPADLDALDAYRGDRKARQLGPGVYALYGKVAA